jgi:hypothetical protein
MSSLRADFDELRERIRRGRELGHASFEPIYYLIFSPDQIIEVKRQTPAWVAKLHQEGWDVYTFSIAENLWDLIQNDPFWSLCLTEDKASPLDWARTNKALADIIASGGGLLRRLEQALRPLEAKSNGLLLVTDLEALHPFLRIGAVESRLQGQFHIPTVFLYPGVRTGKTRLKFLGFYPEDGNYRSVHVGG